MARKKFEARNPLTETPRETVVPTPLRPRPAKAIKRYAFDQEIPATEVMQTAVDEYLKSRGSPTDV